MSKYLAKIMSICALVVMLTASIVGAAVCVTEAIGVSLTVRDSEVLNPENGQKYNGTESNVAIYIDGKLQEKNKVQVSKYTEVKVVWSGTGYDFEGWYEGDGVYNASKDKLVGENKKEYTFEVKGNTVLTAVKKIQKFDVTYTGELSNGNSITEQIDDHATVSYGDDLAQLVKCAGFDHVSFLGWRLVDDKGNVSSEVYTKAVFDTKAVKLEAAWTNGMVLYLKDKATDTVIATPKFNSQEELDAYTLPNASSAQVASQIAKGYKYGGWVDENNQPITHIDFDINGKTVYLKQDLIYYSVVVAYKNGSTDTSQSEVVKYNVRDGFENYHKTRAGYTFKGVKIDNVLYEYNAANDAKNKFVDLGAALINDTAEIVYATAVWECEYSSVTFGYAARYDRDGDGFYFDAKADGNVWASEDEVMITFSDEDGEGNYDLADDAYEVFLGKYSNIQKQDGTALTFTGEVIITVTGTSISERLNASVNGITLQQIVAFMAEHNASALFVEFIFA